MEKNVRGPKISSAKTVRRNAFEVEIEEHMRPAVGSYDLRSEPTAVGGEFTKGTREVKEKKDFRRAIDPQYDAVKRVAP